MKQSVKERIDKHFMERYPDHQMPNGQAALATPAAAPPKEKEKPWRVQPELLLDPQLNCSVYELQNGDGVVVFRVPDAVTMRRLKLRANGQDLAMHLWENILKRAVTSYTY